jgi:hypothetical protein
LLQQNSELAREKMWSRIYLTPLLQAEEDRDQARRYFADQAREKALLGTQTSAYNSDRCVFIFLGAKNSVEAERGEEGGLVFLSPALF